MSGRDGYLGYRWRVSVDVWLFGCLLNNAISTVWLDWMI
jgi:hypothetical protein